MNRFCTLLGPRLFAVKENSSESNLELFGCHQNRSTTAHERTRDDYAITG